MNVLERIKTLCKERGWTLNYLAMESGLTQSTLNNLYSRNSEPKISTLRAICDAFGISLSDFFKEDENDENEDELIKRVRRLSKENKTALLQIVRNLK